MTVPFRTIPSNVRLPLFWGETDNSKANTATGAKRSLVIGQMAQGGTGQAGVPVRCQGVAAAKVIGGAGSVLALMVDYYRRNDPFGELWVLPVADPVGGVTATGTVVVTSAPTANGALCLYIGGVRISQPVSSTMTAAQVAAALAATISATPDLPVVAAAKDATVTVTAVNAGSAGNEIDLRLNYGGAAIGEVLPTGLAVTVSAMSGGAGVPDLTAPLANLGDLPFEVIVYPYADPTSLNANQAVMSDQAGRWSWSRKLYGHAVSCVRGTLATVATIGTTRNDPHASLLGFFDSPSPAWAWAAALGAQTAVSVRADPSQPIREVPLVGILAPPVQSRFIATDRNTLLFDGISTFKVGDDGTVYLEKLITTYQKNSFGQVDNSYLDAETLFNLANSLRRLEGVVSSKYSRVKLADNGTRFAPGSAIVTPNIVRADIVAEYRSMETDGLVQGGDLFKQGLIVERDGSSPNRLNVLWPAVLIGRLDIFALLAQFRLS